MKTQLVLCIGGSLLAGMSACKDKSSGKEVPMNVIYILADDLGYGDIGCYGQQKIKTPNLDKMAREGMLFTQHYGCTVSAPFPLFIDDRFAYRTFADTRKQEIAPEGQQPMEADTYTLGKLMKFGGYETGIFGKWGLGYPGSSSVPSTMGFDEFFGYNCLSVRLILVYPDHLWHNNDTVFLSENDNNGRKVYSQDLIHEQALKFIRDNKDKPFYAMVHLAACGIKSAARFYLPDV